jgi:hypothetical protein
VHFSGSRDDGVWPFCNTRVLFLFSLPLFLLLKASKVFLPLLSYWKRDHQRTIIEKKNVLSERK